MRLVFGQDDLVARYVSDNLGVVISPPLTAIGATRDGQTLCAGAVFTDWNGSNLDIHLYGDGAITRGCVRGIYHYAFVQCGANRLTAVTRRTNHKMKKHLPKLGFQFEGLSKRFFGPTKPEDGFRFALFPEDALKWMNRYGQ